MYDHRQNIDTLLNLLKAKLGETESKCLLDTIFYLFDNANKLGSIEMYPARPSAEFLNSNRLLPCNGSRIPEKAKPLSVFLGSENTPDYTGMFLRGNNGERKFDSIQESQFEKHSHEITEQESHQIKKTISIQEERLQAEVKPFSIQVKGTVQTPDMQFRASRAKIARMFFSGSTSEAGEHGHTASVKSERNHAAKYRETNLKSEMIPDGLGSGSRRAYIEQTGDKETKMIEYKDEFDFSIETGQAGGHSHEIKLQATDIDLDLDIMEIKGKELSLDLPEIQLRPEVSINPIPQREIGFELEIEGHGHGCESQGGEETRPVNMPVYYYIHY